MSGSYDSNYLSIHMTAVVFLFLFSCLAYCFIILLNFRSEVERREQDWAQLGMLLIVFFLSHKSTQFRVTGSSKSTFRNLCFFGFCKMFFESHCAVKPECNRLLPLFLNPKWVKMEAILCRAVAISLCFIYFFLN